MLGPSALEKAGRFRQAACGRPGQRRAPRAAGGVRARAAATPPVTRDATADIMQAAVEFSLQRRLKEHHSIKAEVDCDALGVLEGRFRSMAIIGEGWVTPLGMTARRLEVNIRGLHVDYGALVMQRKVALKGAPPKGHTTITLNARDLAAFTQHPLFQRAAAAAGHAFAWDPTTVSIVHRAAGAGEVRFEGVWAADGERYCILMQPGSGGPAAPTGGAAAGGAGAARAKLRVGALHLPRGGAPASREKAAAVAGGVAHFFTSLALDLDGIDVARPALALRPLRGHGGGGGGGAVGAGWAEAAEGEPGVLDITMEVRIRSFPPLNMQF
ncbi:MAG: hypothetical protein J3K34DRAFT_517131 [Monoraphidium minutum]|nr:MAG: hypothetical protein J3K34DRAFT_517131 [Monoraphidium minutum]